MATVNENGARAFATLKQYLDHAGWQVEEIEPGSSFRSRKERERAAVIYYFQIKTELEQFLFYIVPEINVFKELLHPAAEYICRANFGMRIGNFELDFRDGQVAFRSSINFKGVPLSEKLIDNMIQPALTAYEEFYPGLIRVLAALDTPAQAIAKIEYAEK